MPARLWDRRSLGAALAGAAVASRVCAQPPLASEDTAHHPADAALGAGADRVGRVTVAVMVNGAGPYDFVVDTGANSTVLAAEVAAGLGLPSAGPASIHGIAGVEAATTVRVAELGLGQTTAHDLRCPLLPRERLGAAGLLGVDALKGRHVFFDFEARQVRIRRSGAGTPRDGRLASVSGPAAAGVVTAEARYRAGQLVLMDALLGGEPVTAFLDSGSDTTIGNLALRRLIGRGRPPLATYMVQLLSATGQTAMGEVAPLPTLKFGGLRMDRLEAVFADLHVFDLWDLRDAPTLLIGVDILRHFDGVGMDYGRREVIFHLPKRWQG